jgi:phosphoribosylglycinamide formyltransferase-1
MQPSTLHALAVLVSGTGSNLEAIIAADVPIAVVAADRECRALEVAHTAGIPTELVERADFGANFDRVSYTEELAEVLKKHYVDLVAMAGFMTVLSKEFFEVFSGRVLNTHPSLLPLFKGDYTVAVKDALEAGVKETGCTIHIVTAEMDAGPIIAQEKVPVMSGDTVDTLHERIKKTEWRIYPKVLNDIISEALILPPPGTL